VGEIPAEASVEELVETPADEFSEATAEPAQPAAEEMLESPAEELVSESVAEVQESIEEPGASAETADSVAETPVAEEPAPPVRSLFASRLRMPPPAATEQAGDRRGFGGCRCAARGFESPPPGFTQSTGQGFGGQPAVGGNVDVFSQDSRADCPTTRSSARPSSH